MSGSRETDIQRRFGENLPGARDERARDRKPWTDAQNAASPPERHALRWGRAVTVALVCASVAVLLSVDAVYATLQRALSAAEPLIIERPLVGAAVFVSFAAISAILAFFSSALLLPAAVFAWGNTITLILLWLGWMLGGIGTYALGRGLRGTQVQAAASSRQFDYYLQRVPGEVTFALVLLLYLALPSEVPGYLCGYLRVRFRTYFAAMALAELPYAVGAVLLADSVVNRQVGWLVVFGLVGAALSLYALRVLHDRLDHPS